MVFREILRIWKSQGLLKQSLSSVEEMFECSEIMMKNSVKALMENKNVKLDIYEKDKKLNQLEVDTRKKIFEHLSINPAQDVAASLTLVGVVRDLERIGDFSKNIVELDIMYPKKFGNDKYVKILVGMKNKIFEIFSLTRKSFQESDKQKAETVVNTHKDYITKTADNLIEDIMSDDKIKVKEAITYVLLSRYLKRISAHSMNIASTVVNPFHTIRHREAHVSLKG